MQPIRVGVIGLGEVAQIIHLPILQALADRYEIGALCDVSPSLLTAMGERYGVAPERRYLDAHDLAAQPDLDAVFVLDSDEYHAEHAIAAIERGKHALIEKPMCMTMGEAEAIVAARDAAGVQVMVAYMRRFAPAFIEAKAAVARLPKINYARVRDIIGQNRLIIDQASHVVRPTDIPEAAAADRAERAQRLVTEAIGEAPPELVSAYRMLLGLGSHDLSAMRELIGPPQRVIAAVQSQNGRFLSALFAYDGYHVAFETGVDRQRRFDVHLQVYGDRQSIRVQYDTPYIRHLPTRLFVEETRDEAFDVIEHRPTFTDAYTRELEYFHRVVVERLEPKTPPEDFMLDLRLFREIIDRLRESAA